MQDQGVTLDLPAANTNHCPPLYLTVVPKVVVGWSVTNQPWNKVGIERMPTHNCFFAFVKNEWGYCTERIEIAWWILLLCPCLFDLIPLLIPQ